MKGLNKELILKYKSEFDSWLKDEKSIIMGYIKSKTLDTEIEWLDFIDWTIPCGIFILNDEYVELRKALAEGKTVEVLTDTLNINRTYWDATLEVESYLRKKGAYQYFKFPLDSPPVNRKNYLFYIDCGGDYPEGFINGCSISKEDNLYNYTYKRLDEVHTWVKTQNIDTNIEVHNYRIKPEESKFKVGDWVYNPATDSVPCQFSEDMCRLGLALWEPKIGERCWFSDNLYEEPTLSILTGVCYINQQKNKVHKYYTEYSDCNGKNFYKICQPFMCVLPIGMKKLKQVGVK